MKSSAEIPTTARIRIELLFEQFGKIYNKELSNGLRIRPSTIRPLRSPGTFVQTIDRIFKLKEQLRRTQLQLC